MPKCAHCNGGKARRPCPALDAAICSRCCGTHQRRAIDCPDGCAYLRTKGRGRGYRSVSTALTEFAAARRGWSDRATLAYFCGGPPQPGAWEDALVGAYAAVGYTDDDGRRAVDHWADEHGSDLRPDEQEALAALLGAQFSMFEVESVTKGESLTLLDLVSGDRLRVQERTASHDLVKYCLLLGWVIHPGDHWELMGAQCEVPRTMRDAVHSALVETLQKRLAEQPDVTPQVLMSAAIPAALRALRREVDACQDKTLVTTDGEAIVFCEAAFAVQDAAAVRSRLALHPDVEADHEEFVWLTPASPGAEPMSRTVLGRLFFRNDRLTLATQSRERLERGKVMFGQLLTGVASHLLDTIEDLEVAMAAASERAQRTRANDVSDEARAEIGAKMLQDHLANWIDEPLPALGGKTMREAVASEEGRGKVVELLKDQEHIAQGLPGGDRVDFGRVWEELGLGEG